MAKKWGILIKKESESLDFTGLKIPRDYFVVEEDKSIFPFEDRMEMARQGIRDLTNVEVMPSGKFMISSLTFPEYFRKEDLDEISIDPSADVELFGKYIAPALGITVRFAGDEPFDPVTAQYNDAMARILLGLGIEFKVVGRKELDGEAISASRVRTLLKERRFDEIRKLVPDTTLEILLR